MIAPTTIKENGNRWTVENARPLAMRLVIGAATPVVIAAVGWTMYNDRLDRHWGMMAIRGLFALLVLVSARFALFGAESLAIEGRELVYRRGKHEERCPVADVERLEREGNHLRVHVRGAARPIIVGAGLRQQPSAMQWLVERLEAAITAARTGT